MKNLILGLTLLLGIGFAAPKAEANYFYYSGVGAYYTGWGWYPTYNFGIYPYDVYGYSYYPYYRYRYTRPLPYAAISYSKSTGKTGFSFGTSSQADATSGANTYCGQPDCAPVVWVQGGCAAVATDANHSRLGWGYHRSKQTARSKAMIACRRSGTDKAKCTIAASVCSGD